VRHFSAFEPAEFRRLRDPDRSLDSFDFDFNRALIFDLATARFIQQREDALFLGPPGTRKSHGPSDRSSATRRRSPLCSIILHRAHVLRSGPKSWRTEVHTDLRTEDTSK
jgi:hypothetical protein